MGKRRENVAWRSELCDVMYGEQHLFICALFVLLACAMYNLVKSFEIDNGGNTLISARRNGMLLPVDRTKAATI